MDLFPALPSHRLAKFIADTAEALWKFVDLPNNPHHERRGGYLTVLSLDRGLPLLVVPIGMIEIEKASRYIRFSQEKAVRLFAHQPEHDSSWQSRDEGAEQYGGAIVAPTVDFTDGSVLGFILSFSGLPEHGDEALMLYAGIKSANLSRDRALKMAHESGNPFFEPLMETLGVCV